MKDHARFSRRQSHGTSGRTFLADHGRKITDSQSLELMAKAFGVADWNTLAAAISGGVTPTRIKVATSSPAIYTGIRPRPLRFSGELELAVQRALGYGDARKHQYTTLEHLLLALTDDANASKVMRACGVDLATLQKSLID
jgi:Clp amino terminal domain, pathogenicity island component/Glyoxalase superfamily protein